MAATEAKALCDQTVDLSLPVLLADALIGRQPGQGPLHVIVIWLPHNKQPPRNLQPSRSMVEGSTILIKAHQSVSAVVMGSLICVVLCCVGSESAAERILPVQDDHQHEDHYTKRYTGH